MNKNFKFFIVGLGIIIIGLICYDQFANQQILGVNPNHKTTISTKKNNSLMETSLVTLTKLGSPSNKDKNPNYTAYIEGNDLANTSTSSNKMNTLYFKKLSMDYPNYIQPKEIIEKKGTNDSIGYSAIKLGNLNESAPYLEVIYTSKKYNAYKDLTTLYTDFLNLKIDAKDTNVTLEKTKDSVLFMDLNSTNYLFKKVIETNDGNYYIFYNGLSTHHVFNDVLNSIDIEK